MYDGGCPQQLSIFYAVQFCLSDPLHLLLLVTAWYYLRPSEKQSIVARIKCDPDITRIIWNIGGWTELVLLTDFDIPTTRERKFLEKFQGAGDFPFLLCTLHYAYSHHKNLYHAHQISPVTTFHSPNKALFQYYPTMYTYFSQEVSIWKLLEYFVYLLNNAMQQRPSWEADWFSASLEVPRVLWNPKVHNRICKIPLNVRILSKINPVHGPRFSHLQLGLLSCQFTTGFPARTLYAPLLPPYLME